MKHRTPTRKKRIARIALKHTVTIRRLAAVFTAAGIGLLGYALLSSISAATYAVPKEVETATLAGNAASAAQSGASGGNAVSFGGANGPWSDADLFVDPLSNAATQAKAWANSNPAGAARMTKMAQGPMVEWMGNWEGDGSENALYNVTRDYMNRVTAQGPNKIGLLAAYGILQRDCGGYSTGGYTTRGQYEAFIRGISRGIGTKRAILILEPDALPQLTACLDGNGQNLRLSLLSNAVNYFKANNKNTKVYLDAGNSGWIDANTMADRLRRSNVAAADGFATNVSNFKWTNDEIAFGTNISNQIGNKPFIVDTSRNGLGPKGGEWCNPSGRALGQKATFKTNNSRVAMFLWIKQAGESDGACNGSPGPGVWWPSYADGLAQRAGY